MTALADTLRTNWLQAISEAEPAGADAKYDPLYASVREETAKLEKPTAERPDWSMVLEQAEEITRDKSKDLLILSYAAAAMLETRGLSGLSDGVGILAESMDGFWDVMHPPKRRLRARRSALNWFIDRAEDALADGEHQASENVRDELTLRVSRLQEVVTERFGEDAPSVRRLSDLVARLSVAPTQETHAAEASEPEQVRAPSTAAPKPAPVAPPELTTAELPDAPADPSDQRRFTAKLFKSLGDSAARIRRQSLNDPLAYRLLRAAIIADTHQLPPADTDERTALRPPNDDIVRELEALAKKGAWEALVDAAESQLSKRRLWLDLHRYSAEALAALGPAHDAACRAAVAGSIYLIRCYPDLSRLQFSDGRPLADASTRRFFERLEGPPQLRSQVAAGQLAGHPEGGAVNASMAALASAEEAHQQLPLERAAREGVSARQRFVATLELGRTVIEKAGPKAAITLFERLEEDIEHFRLEQWEPELTASCCETHLSCLRRIDDPKGTWAATVARVGQRLARVDPWAAVRALS